MISTLSFVVGAGAAAQALADRALVTEEVLRELAVDDGDRRLFLRIERGEVAALEEADAHGLK